MRVSVPLLAGWSALSSRRAPRLKRHAFRPILAGMDLPGPREPASPSRRLLEESPYDVARRFASRERATEAVAAAAFPVAAGALAATTSEAPAGWLALGLVLAYAVSARVTFHVGAGSAVPTQLVLVPMLFLLPPSLVPLLVAAGLVLSALPEVMGGRAPRERLLAAVVDAWHSIGAAAVLVAAEDGAVAGLDWRLLAGALAGQVAVDAAVSCLREWAGRGISPLVQLRVLGWIYAIDALLTPIAALAVAAADRRSYVVFAVLALVALLALLARDRALGVHRAAELTRKNRMSAIALEQRLYDLGRERARLRAAIERVGRAFSSSLDRDELLDIVLQTAIDAVDADCGRIRLANGGELRHGSCDGLAPALLAAEAELGPGAAGEGHAVARPLSDAGLIAVGRRGRAFTAGESDALEYLAAQAAASIANVALHERAARQAMTDELTGLANHRRFHELLAEEERGGAPHALIILDIDDFKLVNDRHGHQTGDAVLRAVGDVVRANCRGTDEAARYGGEEIAVVLPGTTLERAHEVAERIRAAIAAHPFPIPGGGAVQVTASVGVAAAAPGRGQAELLAAADAALYTAKRGGKNRTVTQRAARVA
jgi:diguanylate cyclase (GGDEF)-like protein